MVVIDNVFICVPVNLQSPKYGFTSKVLIYALSSINVSKFIHFVNDIEPLKFVKFTYFKNSHLLAVSESVYDVNVHAVFDKSNEVREVPG